MSDSCVRGALRVRILLALLLPMVSVGQDPGPPIARQAPAIAHVHGRTLVDPYSWLERQDAPEVITYLKAENSHTEAVMRNSQGLQDMLYLEMRSRLHETDPQPPARVANDWYYVRSAAGSDFLLLCRRRGSLRGTEEVLVDLNRMAGGGKKPNLGVWRVSPNRRYLAYSVDTEGREAFTVHVCKLEGDRIQREAIPGTGRWFEWAADSETLFYTTPAYGSPSRQLKRHRIGRPVIEDQVLHSDSSRLALTRTATGEFVFLLIYGNDGISEVRFLPAVEASGCFQVIEPRRTGVRYQVAQQGKFFYLLVNDSAAGSHVVRVPVGARERPTWEEVVPAKPGRDLQAFEVAGDELILAARQDGLTRITTYNLPTGTEQDIRLPEASGAVRIAGNLEREFPIWPGTAANAAKLVFESFVRPRSVYEYDVKRRVVRLIWQSRVPDYDPELYESRRVFARAADGTRVPISLTFRKPLVQDGQRPLLLYVYGSVGYSVNPWFDAERVSLLDRGFVFAVAHVRGGGELGRAWHEAAMGRNKALTITDFIASAEYLLAERYTSRDKLAITGHSAGGLPVTAAANMRPELFRAVLAKAPVVTVFRPSDTPGRLSGGGEFGDPNEMADFEAMYAYAPYHNIKAQDYPHMLVTSSRTDPRASHLEAAKFVARLRATKTDRRMLLLRTDFEGSGHMGAVGRLERLRETAFEYAFLFEALQIPH